MIRRLLRDPVLWTIIGIGLLIYLLTRVGGAGESPSYRRADWPHWRTVEVDGRRCAVRVHVLRRDLRRSFEPAEDPAVAPADPCTLPPGVWISPYTGQVIRDAPAMDVDHLVPLGWAARHGGSAWSRARKTEYANDLTYRWHLVAVELALNRQKGDQGPATWVPPNRAVHCTYGQAWATVLVVQRLRVDEPTRAAIARLVATC